MKSISLVIKLYYDDKSRKVYQASIRFKTGRVMYALYWVRNDLRINDNPTLSHFYPKKDKSLAVWCPTASSLRAKKYRLNNIHENLKSHALNLKLINVNFQIKDVEFINFLTENYKTCNFSEIYFSSLHSFEEKKEEERVIDFCNKHDVKFYVFDQQTLIEEKNLPFSIENMPFTFTEFRKKCEANLIIQTPLDQFSDLDLEATSVGEGQALLRLNQFIWETQSILTYKETRNGMLEYNDSSKLSTWLSVGAISARKIYYEIKKFEKTHGENDSTYWLFFELL